MVGHGGGIIRSLSDMIGRVTGRGESSRMTRGRRTMRRGDASSSAPAAPEDCGTTRVRTRRRGACMGSPSPVASSPAEEEEDDGVHEAQASGDEEERQEEEEEASAEEEDDNQGGGGEGRAIPSI